VNSYTLPALNDPLRNEDDSIGISDNNSVF